MNLSLKFQSRPHPECGEPAFGPLMVDQRCYCNASPSSTSQQTSQNYQVGLQTAPGGPGIALGAGSSAGAITAIASNSGNSTTNSNNTTVAGDVTTSLAGLALAGQTVTAMQEQSDHSADIISGIGGAAINLGAQVTGEAFQFAQNQSVLNYNALNQNTSLAFSTINAISQANASGAISAAAQNTLAASVAAAAATQPVTPVYVSTGQQPYSGASATGTGISTTEIVGLGIAVVAIGIFMHAGKR